MFELRVLGSLDLHGPDGQKVVSVLAQPKRAALLVYLALASPRGLQRRDKLIGLFWPERDQEHARAALRKAVYFLRQSLGAEIVASQGDEEVGLAEGAVRCDAVAFEATLDAGDVEEALALYRGDLLEGFYVSDSPEFERWLDGERARFRGRASEAAWTLAEREEADGNGAGAASWARKAASFSPDDEGALRRHLELLDRVGDRAGAVKEYEGFARRLKEEYEIEPSPETQELIAAIREREVATADFAKPGKRPGPEPTAKQAAQPPGPATRPTGLKGLISEVHRRSLWQVLLVYTGGALIAYQAVQALTEGLGLPDWFPGMAVVLFIVLLPVVLATAFVQEGGPPLTRQKPAPVPQAAATAAEGEPRAQGILTWRNSIVGGVLAFVLLAVAVSGYMGMRMMGIGPWGTLIAKGVLDERDLIVLADFEDNTNDSLALALTSLVRVDLEQSPAIRVADDDYVSRVLERMEKEPDAELTYDLAREVAVREGLKAVVAGEAHGVGSGYVLSLRVVAAEAGETLASFRETASDIDATIPAIEQMSRKLRELIGESLKTVRGSPALSQARTASLEALRLHTEAGRAYRRGERSRAIELYSLAIEIDTAFAAAYRGRGIAFGNLERWRRIADLRKAYELSHRLPLWERYHTEARYHSWTTGWSEKVAQAYRKVLELKPDYASAVSDLGLTYWALRQYAQSEEMYRRRLEMDSLAGWSGLSRALFNQGKFDEAWETVRQWEAKMPEHQTIPARRANFASSQGDYDAARAYLRQWRDLQSESLLRQARFNMHMARLAQVEGRLSEAVDHFRSCMAFAEEADRYKEYFEAATQLASLRLWFQGDTTRALETLTDAFERQPWDSVPRPYVIFAALYAAAGETEQAREVLVEWETAVPPEERGTLERYRRAAWGAVALAEGRVEEAILEFRFVQERDLCPICAYPLLGRAHELAGQPDSALAMYERYLTTPYHNRLLSDDTPDRGRDQYWLSVVYERLGDLYEQRSDTAKAIYYYGKLVDLWKDADPELQPRVDEARRAIRSLSPDT